jgi:hypothetical protein
MSWRSLITTKQDEVPLSELDRGMDFIKQLRGESTLRNVVDMLLDPSATTDFEKVKPLGECPAFEAPTSHVHDSQLLHRTSHTACLALVALIDLID